MTWKNLLSIKKSSSYENNFKTDSKKDKGLDIFIRTTPKNIDITDSHIILMWHGSIEVYKDGFGSIISTPDEIEVNIEYMKDDDEEYYNKELSFDGQFKIRGSGNPKECNIDIDFSNFENPKITKVEVIFGGKFNDE